FSSFAATWTNLPMAHEFRRTGKHISAATMPAFLEEVRQAADDGRAIILEQMHFAGPCLREYFHTKAHMRFERCQFDGTASFAHGRFGAGLAVIACRFCKGLSLANARVDGVLALDRTLFLSRPPDDSDREWASVKQPALYAPWLQV